MMLKPLDAPIAHWSDQLPPLPRGLARLSRLDRPVGWRLLWLPCLMGLALARTGGAFSLGDLGLAVAFLVGAIAMRGAGCAYNDILDRDIDAQIARTAARPIPAGEVSLKAAWTWVLAQCGVGLLVLLTLPRAAQMIALLAIPLVALYPLMKRITWWPQAWLGLAFSWGALVAGAAISGTLAWPTALLYTGCVLWTIAYDTIYALQDVEDDALVGVRSTARLFGDRWRAWTGAFLLAAFSLWAGAMLAAGAGFFALALSAPALWAGIALARVEPSQPQSALAGFKAHVGIGAAVALVFALDPLWRLAERWTPSP